MLLTYESKQDKFPPFCVRGDSFQPMNKNNYLIKLSESEQTDFGRLDFAEQSEPQQVFSTIWELESHVNNGGFDSYLRYVEPASIAFAPIALRTICATACAAVVEQALSHVFGSQLPSSQAESEERLDALSAEAQGQLYAIDHAFIRYPDDLTELLFAFVASHADAFGPIPDSAGST
jgi:hypothetical protein